MFIVWKMVINFPCVVALGGPLQDGHGGGHGGHSGFHLSSGDFPSLGTDKAPSEGSQTSASGKKPKGASADVFLLIASGKVGPKIPWLCQRQEVLRVK